ncbi:MAG: class I SAM-dependent DNA methyltransferase, partial [Gammaproteobacteria bacterium]|nr:class I SAM-dependent DNA methyltransferase [Gammaproteobacteria bacterium]
VVVDVGNTIELYSEFTRSGGNYVPFPDPHSYRLTLDALRDEAARARLRSVWDDPLSLDPSRRSARVTREIANRLANLAKSLEERHDPESVAQFLMRCLFTMFAEDVRLLPEGAFTELLRDLRQDPTSFKPMVEHLWGTMNSGGFSVVLRQAIPRFNGGLFATPEALPLEEGQIQLLIEAAQADWHDVEP